MELNIILAAIFLHFLALISPGPDFFIMTQSSLADSKKSAFGAALGIACGNLIHMLIAMLGFAAIVSQSVILFNLIKFLGALYLIFLGCQLLTVKKLPALQNKKSKSSFSKNFLKGLLSATLNPKVTLFYLSLFTLIIPSTAGAELKAFIIFTLFFNTLAYNTVLLFFFSRKYIQNLFARGQKVICHLFGAILVGLGVKVLFSKD